MLKTRTLWGLMAMVAAALVLSGIAPRDRGTWVLEVFPVVIAAPILIFTYKRFQFTGLIYVLITLHAFILIYGGAYTYAHVPLGEWLRDWFHLTRNPYDKIGHFMQGVTPVMIAREILLKGKFLTSTRMTNFLSVTVALAISAFYELIEWGAAIALGKGADEFLGLQDYVWDTQADILYALIGAVTALVVLARVQDRGMGK